MSKHFVMILYQFTDALLSSNAQLTAFCQSLIFLLGMCSWYLKKDKSSGLAAALQLDFSIPFERRRSRHEMISL